MRRVGVLGRGLQDFADKPFATMTSLTFMRRPDDIPLRSALLHFRSLSDGELVRGDQTPADLGLEAGGQLDLVAALTRSPPPGRFPRTAARAAY